MIFNRKHLNISLLSLAILLGGTAVWLSGLPPLGLDTPVDSNDEKVVMTDDTTAREVIADALLAPVVPAAEIPAETSNDIQDSFSNSAPEPITVTASGFEDVNPERLIANHPFRKEALKILNNHLEESDSISRRKILSYCEHLRKSYTGKDINFIRQVFSDNALIIVGNVVKTGRKSPESGNDTKVSYAVRSKHSYINRLAEVFKANKKIKMEFSDFSIMRHPSLDGLYGVTLRQKYSADGYSDDGYLFLLWDFRNQQRPQIHVRTWQPHKIISEGEEIIDISDFNIE